MNKSIPESFSSVEHCYLASLCDCRGELTREHPFTKAFAAKHPYVLKVIGDGAPNGWDRPDSDKCAMILCEGHNNLLGQAVDKELYDLLLFAWHEFNDRENSNPVLYLHRATTVAAILKVYYGCAYAGQRDRRGQPVPVSIAKAIIQADSDNGRFTLFLAASADVTSAMAINPWVSSSEKIVGVELRMRSFGLLVWLEARPPTDELIARNGATNVEAIVADRAYGDHRLPGVDVSIYSSPQSRRPL